MTIRTDADLAKILDEPHSHFQKFGQKYYDREVVLGLMARTFKAGRDIAFTAWLGKLSDELRSTYGYTPPQVDQYVAQQPEVWREYFNDDYSPTDAAAEDQRAGVE